MLLSPLNMKLKISYEYSITCCYVQHRLKFCMRHCILMVMIIVIIVIMMVIIIMFTLTTITVIKMLMDLIKRNIFSNK